MNVNELGEPLRFDELKPGDFFVTDTLDGHVEFGITLQDRRHALILNKQSRDGKKAPTIVAEGGSNWSVLKIDDAVLRPKIEDIAFRSDDKSRIRLSPDVEL